MGISDDYSEFLEELTARKVDFRELVDWRDFCSDNFDKAILFVYEEVSTVTRMAFERLAGIFLEQREFSAVMLIVRYDLAHGDFGWSSVLGKTLGCAGEIFTISEGRISRVFNILNCQDEQAIREFLSSSLPASE